MKWKLGVLFLCLAIGPATVPAAAIGNDAVSFAADVRPILADKCFACHGPDAGQRQAELRLDIEESAKAARDGQPAVVPGSPAESGIMQRITSDDDDLRMPPPDEGKDLSPEEIDVLRQWVAEGAGWSRHWSFIAPEKHPVPAVADSSWPRNWIDNFVLMRLKREGVEPANDTDPTTLIRRLHFDLIGLPPAPDVVDQFVDSHGDARAYEQLVDQLLASDRYGERMAMYWLDLVRYADTVGYHGDQEHLISPYRDYVIDAFNNNLPFDDFSREQLAGDLIPDSDIDQKIASGYNRLLQTSHEGGVQPKEYLAMYGADRVRNLSAVWMAATMGCSECHDHKFDPYTMQDFYSLQAFFADLDDARHLFKVDLVRKLDALPTDRSPEIEVLSRRERQRVAKLEERVRELENELAAVPPDDANTVADLEANLEEARGERERLLSGKRLTMVSSAVDPRTVRILPRGNWLDESGPVVTPAVPEFLGQLDIGDRRPTRLDLANWLTDPTDGVGGLTSRAVVNRFWYLMFGVGIAPSLDDFGGQGDVPVHPELLDNLAVQFVTSGWDVKHVIKLLVMSRTYRQSSAVSSALMERDPYNHLFARQSRFRLQAEMIRDNLLSVSGLLVMDYGGASVRPYQPAGYYRHLNFPSRTYEAHLDRRQWRRGVYVHWQRQFVHPMMRAFDAPRREECTARRTRSTTPSAALVILNDPTFVEASRVFAERIVRDGGDTTESRIDFAMRRAVSRGPNDKERHLLVDMLALNLAEYEQDQEAARQLIAVGQAVVANDLHAVELAAWTNVARALLAAHETMARN